MDLDGRAGGDGGNVALPSSDGGHEGVFAGTLDVENALAVGADEPVFAAGGRDDVGELLVDFFACVGGSGAGVAAAGAWVRGAGAAPGVFDVEGRSPV